MLTPQVTYYRVKDPKRLSNKYLKYYFDSKSFQDKIGQWAGAGSTRAYIGILEQQNLPIRIPRDQIRVQEEIGSALWTIDEKILTNKAITTQLESLAQEIFHYWFTQFDFPDGQGKPYRASGGKMVWNEDLKREIPEGWEAGVMTDLGQIVSGSTPNTSDSENFCEEGIAWITPKDMSLTTDKYIGHGGIDITVKGLKSCSARLMPGGAVLLTSRAPIGYIGIAKNELCTNQGFKSIIPEVGIGSEFVYFTLKTLVPYLKQMGNGSTFKELSKEAFSRVKVCIPHRRVLAAYSAIIESVAGKQKNCESESRELASLRDFLLPLLMSGQVRVGADKEPTSRRSAGDAS
jgi:type I restriction enzyme S subunit